MIYRAGSPDTALKLLLDARKLGDGGIGIYIQNLVDGLIVERAKGFPIEITLIVSHSTSPEVQRILSGWGDRVAIVSDRAKKYSADEHFLMARRLNSVIAESDVFHSPHYTLPWAFGRRKLGGRKVPSVVTIHDTIHLTAPEKMSQKFIGGLMMRSSVRRADHVITVSTTSLSRLSRVFPGVAISVIPNALSKGIGIRSYADVKRVIEKFKLIQPYVMFVGSDRPHKGFQELVLALSQLKHQKPMLVVVGDRFSAGIKKSALQALGPERVRFTGEVVQEDLAALYNGTRAVLVPSRIEGFGLVALEALAAGAPLVCSPEQSLREVAGNCGWYADDFDAVSLRDAISRCLTDRDTAEDKAGEGIKRAREFSCERVAAEHLQVYLSVLPNNRAGIFHPAAGDALSYRAAYEDEGQMEVALSSSRASTGEAQDELPSSATDTSLKRQPDVSSLDVM